MSPVQALVNSPYVNKDFRLSPGAEVDYGVHWRIDSVTRGRVSYIADERKVVAVPLSMAADGEPIVLATDIDFEVVEFLLGRPYYGKGEYVPADERVSDDPGWATACLKGEKIRWVQNRLSGWSGSKIWFYTGKDFVAAETKFAKKFAEYNGYEGRGGGWIYNLRSSRPYIQGWRSFYLWMKRAGGIAVLAVEEGREHFPRRVAIKVRGTGR